MIEIINNIKKEIKNFSGSSTEKIEAFRLKYISKKSVINNLFLQFKDMSSEEKRNVGQPLNELKTIAKDKLIGLSKLNAKKKRHQPQIKTFFSLHKMTPLDQFIP